MEIIVKTGHRLSVVAFGLLAACIAGTNVAAAKDAANAAVVDAALQSKDRPKDDLAQDERRHAREVLQFSGVTPGMHVADMFSAGGYYTELLSGIVGPKGSVIAYNNAEYESFAKKEIGPRYAGNRLPNVKQVTKPVDALELEPKSLDLVMFIMSYHDLYWHPADGSWTPTDPAKLLAKVHAAVKPGGTVIVEDHVAPAGTDPVAGIDKLHRIDPAVVKRDFERAGFKFDGESKALAHPEDDHTKIVCDDSVRGKTDQFIYRFRK